MRKRLLISLTLCLVLAMGASFISLQEVDGASKQTLTVSRVKSAPSGPDDAVWEKAKGLIIPFEGKEKFAGKHANVSTKAVYAGDDIYFLFKWSDSTKSVTKGAWKLDSEKWIHQKGNEDRTGSR